MDILVISDTHHICTPIRRVMERMTALPDAVLFLGDGLSDLAVMTSDKRWENVPVLKVAGNCDGMTDVPKARTIELGGCRIVMMHGDTHGVKNGNTAAVSYALMQGADVLLYGHTHVPFSGYRQIGDRTLLVGNPGTLGAPYGERAQTFGMLTVRDGKPLFSFTELG